MLVAIYIRNIGERLAKTLYDPNQPALSHVCQTISMLRDQLCELKLDQAECLNIFLTFYLLQDKSMKALTQEEIIHLNNLELLKAII